MLLTIVLFIKTLRAEVVLVHGPDTDDFVLQCGKVFFAAVCAQVLALSTVLWHAFDRHSSRHIAGTGMWSTAVGGYAVSYSAAFYAMLWCYLAGSGLISFSAQRIGDGYAANDHRRIGDGNEDSPLVRAQANRRLLAVSLVGLSTVIAFGACGLIDCDLSLHWSVVGPETVWAVSWICVLVLVRSLKSHVQRGELSHLLWSSGSKHHFFLSHYQYNGGDQVHNIHAELTQRGCKVWWDMRSDGELSDLSMKQGVKETMCFVLFLTKEALTRTFVQMEVREAVRLGKPILLLRETDERHGAPEKFEDFIKDCPDDLKWLFNRHEALAYRRRGFEADAMFEVRRRRHTTRSPTRPLTSRPPSRTQELIRRMKSIATHAAPRDAEAGVS
mmetsp:Transcript_900/g.3340  ORF Transcript_900/g.3340 Transcript_900/m.3340 type:complete len:386 (+) Transcript_900:368-1525(+)